MPPPEPDNRDKDGKPLPKPIKVAAATKVKSALKGKKSTVSGATDSLTTAGTDALGNKVKSVKGVTQPLHQIVHTTRFLADDEAMFPDDDEEEDVEEAEAELAEAEDWSGVEDEEEDDDEEEESFEVGSEDDTEPPLQWEDLFDQAVGEAEGGEKDSEDDVEIIVEAPKAGAKGKLSAKAEGKRGESFRSLLSSSSLTLFRSACGRRRLC